MTVDWCPNRRQKFWTGSRCCHDRETNKGRTARYKNGEDAILVEQSRDRPIEVAEFGLRHETRAVESVKADLSFFGIAGFDSSRDAPSVERHERIVHTVRRDK